MSDYVTRSEFTHWRNRAAILYVLLGLVCSGLLWFSVHERSSRVRDLASTAATVVYVRCERTNAVSDVLRSSLKAQLALTDSRRDDGQITQAQYEFSVAALTRSIERLAPQDCAAQGNAIRSSID